ncbi:MAG: UDP-N-acetylmuramoyl-tripeptide--D-alanyl-D-alanine ligase [Alphaproteobacteria bacterium]|nr:UDP-N-acetylmuramoyl-tripeptide--D-alanyl-D-alanine ligase [Alphaproteobacteria bacterium]
MIETISIVLLFLTYAAFIGRRSLTYMHIYQQEEYDSPRFLKWLWANKAFDKRLSFIVVLGVAASFFIPFLFANLFILAGFIFITSIEKDPRRESKKNLVLTSRAKRIFFPAYAIGALSGVWCFFKPELFWLWIITIQCAPLWLVAVNELLQPYEQGLQKKFRLEAQERLASINPKVIAITGSFGKTSVKHILGHILKTQAPTLITPGSVNTPMGIARILREQLEPQHQYLVVEMGAYGPGSIERLCSLTPPDMGIITAIGHAHYERFKSLDVVAETKYELAQAVIAKDGHIIAHERTLRFAQARALHEAHRASFTLCGEARPAGAPEEPSYLTPGDLEIRGITQNMKGLEIELTWRGENHTLSTPLYGIHHGHNVALAFAASMRLGISAGDIQTALQSLPQIQHRLEVKPQSDGTTIIDDAYNSNPVGFQMALDLLSCIETKGRRILVTPGMVELGRAHEDAHEKIGRMAGKSCDIALIVQSARIPSFIAGFRESAPNKPLYEVATFAEAQRWVNQNKMPGDVVLIENDLPDLYERVPRI